MKQKLSDDFGNNEEPCGKKGALVVPISLCDCIQNAIERDEEMRDLVDQATILQKFHWNKKTLQNLISCGKIPLDYFTRGVNGMRFFFLRKMMGLISRIPVRRKRSQHKQAA